MKVLFFIGLLNSALGALGPITDGRGIDFFINVALAAQAGTFWWLCRRANDRFGSRASQRPAVSSSTSAEDP